MESGTALIQGLISGDVNKAVANASAPYIANEIAKAIPDDNKEGRIIAHGIANTALALAKGENAGAQSLGAMTAEAVGMLSQELYNKQPSELSEDEKATVSAFASLAAGIAGGLVGGDSSSAANAAEAGKTTVENNNLSKAIWYLARPSAIGAPVTTTAPEILMSQLGLTQTEAEDFLSSLSPFGEGNAIRLALADPAGNEEFTKVVLATYEQYGSLANSSKNEVADSGNKSTSEQNIVQLVVLVLVLRME
ncbi:VENN motif pre-toxin domain-containing protein [Providencia manganoxydans]|uniref:VENN motif pre-toxin domain-containing protein n=1 Tax=Providencia manganoxydans TaxID=2923283 RepID=UPI0034E4D76B